MRVPFDKKAMQERRRRAKRVLQNDRMRCRAEKHAGRAGPPDCAEAEAGAGVQAEAEEHAGGEVRECQEDGVGGWDIVGADEHLRSPRSCHPPCISHTQARCTVS